MAHSLVGAVPAARVLFAPSAVASNTFSKLSPASPYVTLYEYTFCEISPLKKKKVSPALLTRKKPCRGPTPGSVVSTLAVSSVKKLEPEVVAVASYEYTRTRSPPRSGMRMYVLVGSMMTWCK